MIAQERRAMAVGARLYRVLDYYDGPQVFEARDPFGGHFIGTLVNGVDAEFILCSVEPERLRRFRGGDLDLLELMNIRPEGAAWYLGSFSPSNPNLLELSGARHGRIAKRFLPLPGYILHYASEVESLVKESRELKKLLFAVTVEPPESVTNHAIHSFGLGSLLIQTQRLLKRAHGAWLRRTRGASLPANAHVFDVLALQPGSVRVILEPSQPADLFGTYDGLPALDIIAKLFDSPEDPMQTAGVVQEYRGHLAAAYRDFLSLMIEQDTRVDLAWTNNFTDQVISKSMTCGQAKRTRIALGTIQALTEERVTFTGILDGGSVRQGRWTLITDTGPKTGRIARNSGLSLSKESFDEKYQFDCVEEIKTDGLGRDNTQYWLTRIQKLT